MQLQSQLQTSSADSSASLTHLTSLERALSGSADQDSLNEAIIEIIEVYERSLSRKNAEMGVIKNCLLREKDKLLREKESIG